MASFAINASAGMKRVLFRSSSPALAAVRSGKTAVPPLSITPLRLFSNPASSSKKIAAPLTSGRFFVATTPSASTADPDILVSPISPCEIPSVARFSTLSPDKIDSGSDSDSESDDASLADSLSKCCLLLNPFLKEGPELPYEWREDDDAIYVRVDMPGISKEALSIWYDEGLLHVRGEESKTDTGEEIRKYFGYIDLEHTSYKPEKIKAEVANGVLKIVAPKLPFEERENAVKIAVT